MIRLIASNPQFLSPVEILRHSIFFHSLSSLIELLTVESSTATKLQPLIISGHYQHFKSKNLNKLFFIWTQHINCKLQSWRSRNTNNQESIDLLFPFQIILHVQIRWLSNTSRHNRSIFVCINTKCRLCNIYSLETATFVMMS